MTAKEYLSQLITMDNAINRKQQRLMTLRDVAMNTTPNYSGETVQHTRNKNPLDRAIDRDIDELVDFKAEVWEKLDKIADERYKRILWLRYADRKTWRYIALELNFTIRYIHKMHLKALAELDKII